MFNDVLNAVKEITNCLIYGVGERIGIDPNTIDDPIRVSTVLSGDMGWETALCDALTVHPVERYSSRQEAEEGHEKWLAFAKDADGKQVEELGYGELVEPKTITLKGIK